MKKKLSLLIVAFMALAAYAGLNAWRTAGEEIELMTLTFPDYNDTKVGAYDKDWTATINGKVWSFSCFNNNNNGWEYIKCGPKGGNESTATITTPVMDDVVTSIVYTIDATKMVTSATFTVLNGSSVVGDPIDITSQFVKGDVKVDVADAKAGYSYKLTINSKNTSSSNGSTQISKIKVNGLAPTYTVAGAVLGGDGSETAGFFGTKWDASATANDMTEAEGGIFVKKYENLDLSAGKIAFKVVRNHYWSTAYPSSNYEVTVSKTGKYDFTVTFNPEGNVVNAQLESKDPEPEINSMEIRGNFPGMSWDAEDAVAMTLVAGSTTQWRAIMENVVVEGKTYEYKAFANNATDGYQLPASGNNNFTFGTDQYPAGTYNLTFTADTQANTLTLSAQKVEDPEPTITSMEIRGTFPGMSWDADGAVPMTLVDGSTTAWMVIVEDVVVEAKAYEYKAFANNETTGYQLPAEGNASFTFGTDQYPAGKYNLKFIADTQLNRFECVPLAPTHPDAEPEVTYTVAGAFYYVKDGDTDATEVAIFGGEKGWDPSLTANDMTKGEDNLYHFKKEDVEFVAAGNVQLKVVKDHSFDVASYPEKNKEITIAAAGKYDVVVTFNPETSEVTATATSKDAPAEDTYTAVGVKALWGVNDWTVDKSNNLTKGDDGKYTITKTDLTLNAGDYGYKVVKNGTQWMPDGEGNEKKLTISERAVYSVTLTLDPTAETEYVATATKTGEAEPVVDTYTVAGAFYYVKEGDTDATEVIIFGGDKSWDPSLTANDMTKGEDNLYHFKKEDVELVAAGNVQLKVVKDHSFDVASYPEKNKEITIAAAGKYDIEVTFNPETKEVTATATSKDTPEPATISKVEIRGGIGGDWDKKPIQLTLAPGDPNVYYAVLDATEFTEDFEFKMLVNGDAESESDRIWLGFKEMTLTDPNKWVTPKKEEFGSNLNFANSTSGYQTYHFKAKWTPSAVASAGWELQITEGDPRTAPAPELIVLGNNAELFGAAWDTESTANTMELKDGKYYRTYTKVQPQETDIELKAYNKTNNTWYGNKKDGQNVKFNMKAEGDFTVVLDVNADFTAGNVEVTGDNVEMIYPEPEQPGDATWTVAGDNATLFGETWKPALTANDMVKGEDGLYKWEKTEQTLTAGDVLFKVVKNHSWDNEAYPSDNYKLTIPENGKYTVTITFDAEKKEVAAVATKTGEAIIPDAEITSVQLPGDWNWALDKGADDVEPYLVLTKGENNTWTGVLDLTEVTTDQKFKLVVNKKEWLGLGELTLNAGELVSTETDKDNNFILLNATSGYQTYDVTATWEANASAKAGWTLTIAGKDERPVVTEPVYTLVGAFYDGEGKESASFFGESWKVLEANNLEKIYDGFYKKEYTGINLEKGNVSLKVLKDGDWEHPYPNADGYLLNIPSAGVYDLTFTFHPDESVVRGEADKKSDPIEITRMDIVGDFTGGWPNTESGDWSVAKAMTQDATNPAIWTLTVEGFKAEAKTYEYKATANGQYGVYELPASGNNNWVFGTEAYPAGKYDLLFTANTADNSLTVVPTLTEVETVILDEEETLAENEVLEVDEPFTSDEITVEDGQIITIEADEAGESLVPRRAFRALAASDITIQYKPEAGSDWQDAPVTVETNETGYQFEVTGAVATAINDRGFAIKANKPIVVTQVAVVTEVTPDPEPEPVYYAVGVKALWGVNDWTIDEANKLTLNGEGKYTITKTELTLDANTNYGYKVVKKVGDTQYWIPDGMNNENNLTVTERAVYSVTLTLDPAEPLTAESFTAVATKTGEAEPAADAEITKVEIRGSFNGWDTPADGLVMTKQGETNTYTATLDLTEITEDVQFKLVLNNKVDWLGWGELELVAPENWTAKEEDTGNNIVLKNASTGYKTYTLTATWTPGPVAKTGWKLEIAGKDERPAVPATITKVELRGEFTSWSDGEGVELTKQGETDTYAGVLDLSEITADQAFKLVINDKTYWIDFNHLSLVAPDGWLVKESGEVTEPAIILTNSSTGYKTYDITATWTPSPNAAAGWTLTVAGKDLRPVAEDTYTVFGAFYDGEGEHASILTKTWDPTATENDMVKGDGNVYTKTYADAELTAGTFQLKVAKNHNDATSYPEGYGVNYELPIAAAGKYDVVVTFNADTKEVTAVATPKDVPEANYYIVGTMTEWNVKAEDAYKLTLNADAQAGIVEYKITLDLEANAEFKVVKVQGESQTWYPDGMDNNYKITTSSNYTVYFRPNGDGGDDWHYHYIYAQDNNPTGINGVKADALKDAEVYTINGQRVQNPTKGLYIVNGKKVVIK